MSRRRRLALPEGGAAWHGAGAADAWASGEGARDRGREGTAAQRAPASAQRELPPPETRPRKRDDFFRVTMMIWGLPLIVFAIVATLQGHCGF